VATVTASIGHPLLDCSRTDDVPEGIAPRVAFRTKPECIGKQKGSENVIGPLHKVICFLGCARRTSCLPVRVFPNRRTQKTGWRIL
jgi:hypothetical protein